MWSPQLYLSKGRNEGVSDDLLNIAVGQIDTVANGQYQLPGILSLNHLAKRSDVSYIFLRKKVEHGYFYGYRMFSIGKRSGGRRLIFVPDFELMCVQRWINTHILKNIPAHPCSFAFSKGNSIVKCANRHLGARWMIKIDILGFFESISEIQVFRVFKDLGYQPLVAFELARLTTVHVGSLSPRYSDKVWRSRNSHTAISSYQNDVLGYLPQGAPTSPLLSNLVMKRLDGKIESFAKQEGLIYTRYSDDMTFSTRSKKYSRQQARKVIHAVGEFLSKNGFRLQHRKTTVVPPGARKMVLGLNVDGDKLNLRREVKSLLRMHLYFLNKDGPTAHAENRKFDTIWGMKCHIRGLIDYANMVEPKYARKLLAQFDKINWPV